MNHATISCTTALASLAARSSERRRVASRASQSFFGCSTSATVADQGRTTQREFCERQLVLKASANVVCGVFEIDDNRPWKEQRTTRVWASMPGPRIVAVSERQADLRSVWRRMLPVCLRASSISTESILRTDVLAIRYPDPGAYRDKSRQIRGA